MPITGTTLFVTEKHADHVLVVALAENGEAAIKALDRLANNDFTGCVFSGNVTVCSTGEGAGSGLGSGGSGGAPGGRILILARDNGTKGSRTSALELERILSSVYTVKVWSIKRDGQPAADQLSGYDATIVESGDYAFDITDFDTLLAVSSIKDRAMYIGAQPLPLPESESAPISDLQVNDASHPIAAGFAPEQVITLQPSESGVPAMVIKPDSYDPANFSVIFKRGPTSERRGASAVIAGKGKATDTVQRVILASFAFYQLPDDVQQTFALNAVKWLLEP